MMGMHILGVIGFNPVVPFLGQQYVIPLHAAGKLLAGQDTLALFTYWKFSGKVPAVMAQSIYVGIHISP